MWSDDHSMFLLLLQRKDKSSYKKPSLWIEEIEKQYSDILIHIVQYRDETGVPHGTWEMDEQIILLQSNEIQKVSE